jgi:hypothetical protein
MSLDINTPRGQESVVEENEMLDILKSNYDSLFIHTPIESAAAIDGLIIKDNQLIGIFESKCRRDTLHKFQTAYNNEWLVSWHKLQAGATLSKMLCVPFWGFLYLVPDQLLLVQKLTDTKGECVSKVRKEQRKTSACCNGGTMIDTCGMIDITKAKILRKINYLMQ